MTNVAVIIQLDNEKITITEALNHALPTLLRADDRREAAVLLARALQRSVGAFALEFRELTDVTRALAASLTVLLPPADDEGDAETPPDISLDDERRR